MGRWRHQLSQEEIRAVQLVSGREMRSLSYEVEKVPVRPLAIMKQTLTLPFALLSALKANTNVRGRLLPYLLRRLVPFIARSH